MRVDLKVEADNFDMQRKAIEFIKNSAVYVGIPDSEAPRENEDENTNPEILYIQTNGSPAQHIPPRPVIEPALEKDADRLGQMLKEAAADAMGGDKAAAEAMLEKTGMRGQNVVRAYFTGDNGWPPNSYLVAEAKRRKGATDPHPLIDTGELRKSITYVTVKNGVREK